MKYAFSAFLITLAFVNSANVFAKTYYVKNDGNDNAAGTSDATAWQSLDKVNNFKFQPGDDVYFKAGHTWKLKQLIVDWDGTPENRTTVGSYYMKNGEAIIGVPAGTQKPTISGGYVAPGVFGDVPSNIYGALIYSKSSYVTIQNMRAQDSSGFGITVGGGSAKHNIIENSESHHVVGALFYGFPGSDYLIMRNNEGSQCTWGRQDGGNPLGGSKHPGCMSVQYSSNVLIENNKIYDLWGEGISVTFGGNNIIIRNNIISNGRHVGIYTNSGNGLIIENNMVLGTGSDAINMDGIAFAVEAKDGAHSDGHIIRNNLISGVRNCFYATTFKVSAEAGSQVGGIFIGNTCVGVERAVVFYREAAQYKTILVANNIFWDVSSGTDSCSAPTDSDITFLHNSWPMKPADPDCSGKGDVYGNPLLNTTSNFRLFNYINLPTAKDYEPKPGSNVENAGIPLLQTVIDTSKYPHYKNFASAPPCNTLDTEELELDFRCETRNKTTPDIGAVEIQASEDNVKDKELIDTKPLLDNVSVPFYMNIGSHEPIQHENKVYVSENYQISFDAQKGYTGSTTTPIGGTNNDSLYQSWRGCNCTLGWDIPIENGNYDLVLLFNEQFWGDEKGTCTGGERRFDISIEGILEQDEFDPCLKAGKANSAIEYVKHSIPVSDGILSFQLLPGSTGTLDNKPEITGIEIVKLSPPTKFKIAR